jgi:ATP synthase protein I
MAADDRRPDVPGGAASDADLSKRLSRLSRELEAERQERAEADRSSRANATGYGMAVRLGSEFIAAVLVGAALGWGLDKVAGTSPWGLMVLLLLGFAAGVTNVVRAAGSSGSAAGRRTDGEGGVPPR